MGRNIDGSWPCHVHEPPHQHKHPNEDEYVSDHEEEAMNDDDVQLQHIEEKLQTLDIYPGSPYDKGFEWVKRMWFSSPPKH